MISIIIATYNRKDYLLKSIKSIIGQTYNNFEILVMDDGSTDGTEQMIKDNFNDERIKYIKLSQNSGATVARNRGLEEVLGDYFMVWDSDDILYPHALSTAMEIFTHHDVAVVSSPARSVLAGKEVKYSQLPSGIVSKEIIVCRLLPSNHKIRIAKTSLCGDIRYRAKNIDFLVNVEMSERGNWYSHSECLGDVVLESSPNSLTIGRRKTNLTLSVERAPYLYDYLNKYRDVLVKKCPANYAGFSYGAAIGFWVIGDIKIAKELSLNAYKVAGKFKYLLLYLALFIPAGRLMLRMVVKIKNLF